MARTQRFLIVEWPGGWALYRVHKRKHGNPPKNDLTEIASEAQGNLEVKKVRK